MAETAATAPTIKISITPPRSKVDFATIIGLVVAVSLIGAALVFGGSIGAFFNVPAVFIVVGGTIAVTSISYAGDELGKAWSIIKSSMFYRVRDPNLVAKQLMDLAVLAKQKGTLALAQQEQELQKDPYIALSMRYIADGYQTADVMQILNHDLESLVDRHKKGAGIVRRASEVAPAMGLIGTLVGLVQMLSQLNDPSSIGPAMAVALLTTFYGALLGTVFLAPLAAKLERNAAHDVMIKDLILTASLSISKQENPRKLETVLNAALPPDAKIRYFK
jgi:chemotaxis protein MotA